MQRFTSPLARFDSDLWHFHIVVPEEVVSAFDFEGKARRVICTVNDRITFHCAFMPAGNGQYFINLNKEIRTKLKLNEGDEVEAMVIKDETRYGMPMAEEFEVAMEQDPEAKRWFEELTDGKKRTLLHLVNKVKSSEKRIEKSLVIMEHLKMVSGKIDYKLLNEQFRQAN